MAITDDLDHARRQVAVDATPGASPIAPRPSAGTVAGTALRTGLSGAGIMAGRARQQAAGAARGVVAGSTAPARAGLGVVRDAGRAFGGLAPAANAGQPVGMPSLPSMPSFPRTAPKPSFSDVTSRAVPATATKPAPSFAGVSSRVLPGAAQPAPTSPPASAAAGILRATDASGNNVYSDSAAGLQQGVQLANGQPALSTGGIAPAAAPGPAAGQSMAPRPTPAAAATVAAPRPVPTQAVRGRQGAVIRKQPVPAQRLALCSAVVWLQVVRSPVVRTTSNPLHLAPSPRPCRRRICRQSSWRFRLRMANRASG